MSPTEEVLSQDQLNVLYYLQQFINGLDSEELGSFLQFVTGSSVMPDIVHITFNNLSGQLRRPIAHTCSSTLELSCTYGSLQELKREFTAILHDSVYFEMSMV